MLLKFKTENEWLAARKDDITSTEVASLFGFSPYKSRFKLWQIKAGYIEDDFVESEYSKWGKRLQNVVGMGICEDKGWKGHDLNLYYARDPDLRLGSSFDLKALDPAKGWGLMEIKVAESFDEDNGWLADRAPLEYEFQIQNELHLASKYAREVEWGGIFALGRRQKVKEYHRVYDAKLGERIDIEVESFWKSIVDNKPPEPDYAVDGELLERIRGPLRADDTLILRKPDQNPRAFELADRMAVLKAQAKEIKAGLKPISDEMEAIKYELFDIMGKNPRAIIGKHQITARVSTREEHFNYETSSRRFSITTKG
jgi:predicted phage-related endonuclease